MRFSLTTKRGKMRIEELEEGQAESGSRRWRVDNVTHQWLRNRGSFRCLSIWHRNGCELNVMGSLVLLFISILWLHNFLWFSERQAYNLQLRTIFLSTSCFRHIFTHSISSFGHDKILAIFKIILPRNLVIFIVVRTPCLVHIDGTLPFPVTRISRRIDPIFRSFFLYSTGKVHDSRQVQEFVCREVICSYFQNPIQTSRMMAKTILKCEFRLSSFVHQLSDYTLRKSLLFLSDLVEFGSMIMKFENCF